MIRKGMPIIWGAQPVKPIINIPTEALRVKVRLRAERLARAFVKFSDRVECWSIVPADETTLACPNWKLYAMQSVNFAAL